MSHADAIRESTWFVPAGSIVPDEDFAVALPIRERPSFLVWGPELTLIANPLRRRREVRELQ